MCAPAPCPWVTKAGTGSWTHWRIPCNHPGNCPHPQKPFMLQVREILFPHPTGGRGVRGDVGVPLSPCTAGPCVLQGITRPLLPSAFLQTQNSPRTAVGGCRGRGFLFLRHHRGCWGRYRDPQVGMSRGDMGAAAGADIKHGSRASSGCSAPCLEHPHIPHFGTSLPVSGVSASSQTMWLHPMAQSGVGWGPGTPRASPWPPLHPK